MPKTMSVPQCVPSNTTPSHKLGDQSVASSQEKGTKLRDRKEQGKGAPVGRKAGAKPSASERYRPTEKVRHNVKVQTHQERDQGTSNRMTGGRGSRPGTEDTKCEPTGSRAPARPGKRRGRQTRHAQDQTVPNRATADGVSRLDTHKNQSRLKKGAERRYEQVQKCSPKGERGKPCSWTAEWSQRSPLKAPTPQRGQAWTSRPVEQGPWAAMNSPRQSPVPSPHDWHHYHDHRHDHQEIQGIKLRATNVTNPQDAE
jgi:hypothetical protein